MLETDLIYWLWFVMIMGVASSDAFSLVKKYQDIRKLYQLMLDQQCPFLSQSHKKHISQNTLEKAEMILAGCQQKQISLMTCRSEYYPEKLKNIYAPPVLLFYQGNPAFLRNEKILTAVGTRRPSEYSIRTAQKLYSQLAEGGCTLVSGFAVGLDEEAHLAAIRNEKSTIAVLGCGLDCNYPKGSRPLKEKILENGLILTEYFPGTPPYGRNFPVRNRILSGISDAVLVTEASLRSGCMITANLACEQGKTVFCIPPADIFSSRYDGQAHLLRDGATPVFSADDIFQEFECHEIKPDFQQDIQEIPPEQNPVSVQNTEPLQEQKKEKEISRSFLPEEQAILAALAESEKNINMLCCVTGMKFETVSMHLLELEMMGCITSSSGDFYKLSENYDKL